MRRSWVVRPDHELQTIVPDGQGGHMPGPTIGAVSKNALLEAAVDAAIVLHRLGGTVEIVVNREQTGVEGERATTAAMVLWKDRTDARRAPESDAQPIAIPDAGDVDELAAELGPSAAQLSSIADHGNPMPVTANGVEADVDESDVPEHLRGL